MKYTPINVKATETRNSREEKYITDCMQTIAKILLEKHTNLVEIRATSELTHKMKIASEFTFTQ